MSKTPGVADDGIDFGENASSSKDRAHHVNGLMSDTVHEGNTGKTSALPISSSDTLSAAVWLEFDPLNAPTSKDKKSVGASSSERSSGNDLDVDIATALASSTAVLSKCRRKRLSLRDDNEHDSNSAPHRVIRTKGAINVPLIAPPKNTKAGRSKDKTRRNSGVHLGR